jgi:hypothetical protein
MNWAFKRQLLYFSVIAGIVLIAAGIIVWQAFFTKEPTCFDGIQNQDERGIDCGGICDIACTQDTRPVSVLWQRALPVTDEVYHAVAYIENNNVNAGIKRVNYEFKIYDIDNLLIAERTGHTFIEPNQKSAIFAQGIKVGNRIPALVDFTIDRNATWFDTEERFAQQNIVTNTFEWERMDTTPTLRARVQNVSIFDIRNIELVAIVYDGAGNALATSRTFIDRLNQGTATDATFTWPQPIEGTIARTEILPRMNPFQQPSF